MLRNKRTLTSISANLLILASAVVAHAAGVPQRTAITREQIASALSANGIIVSHDQVVSLSDMTASSKAPHLQVVGVETQSANTAHVRLKCASTDVCLPFYVLLHWQDPDQATNTLRKWQVRNPAQADNEQLPKEEIVVHRGKAVVLVLASRHARITLPVLCLQNGARGQSVRVMNRDSKRIYLATVIAPGLVTSGSLD